MEERGQGVEDSGGGKPFSIIHPPSFILELFPSQPRQRIQRDLILAAYLEIEVGTGV